MAPLRAPRSWRLVPAEPEWLSQEFLMAMSGRAQLGQRRRPSAAARHRTLVGILSEASDTNPPENDGAIYEAIVLA